MIVVLSFYREINCSITVICDYPLLQALFHSCINDNRWQQSLPLNDGESVVIHSPTVMIHTRPNNVWSHDEPTLRPRAVKRSVADIYYQLPEGTDSILDRYFTLF